MSRLSRFLVIAVLGIALVPTAAHAQFFLFPGGGFGGGLGGFGGFGGMPYYGGYGGFPYGYGGGFPGYVTGPSYYTTVTPIVYTVTTPSSGYIRDVPVEPRMRPAVWP